MTEIAEKALKHLSDEYVRTGINDWQNIDTPAGKQLAALGLVSENTLGEFKLTDQVIAHAVS